MQIGNVLLHPNHRTFSDFKYSHFPPTFPITTRLRQYLPTLNIEPVIMLTSTSMSLLFAILPLFIYYARCVELFKHTHGNETEQYCVQISNSNQSNNATQSDEDVLQVGWGLNNEWMLPLIQMDVASLTMWRHLAHNIPSIVSSLLLGAWADAGQAGRKLPLLVAFIGPNISHILVVVCTIIYYDVSIFTLILVADVIAGLTGGGMANMVMQMAMLTDSARKKVVYPGMSTRGRRLFAGRQRGIVPCVHRIVTGGRRRPSGSSAVSHFNNISQTSVLHVCGSV